MHHRRGLTADPGRLHSNCSILYSEQLDVNDCSNVHRTFRCGCVSSCVPTNSDKEKSSIRHFTDLSVLLCVRNAPDCSTEPGCILHTDLLLNTILPITTVFVMYTVIYCALRKQRLKLALSSRIAPTSFSQIEPLQHVQTRQEKLEKQFLLTAFSVVLCMVISFMPYIVT